MSFGFNPDVRVHRLPLECRVCGENDLDRLLKDKRFIEGRARLCKVCAAQRARQYRKGESIDTYIGNQKTDKPTCRVCGTKDLEQLVTCNKNQFGKANLCKPCKAKAQAKRYKQRIRYRKLKCVTCGTQDVSKLVPNPRANKGYNRVCYTCFLQHPNRQQPKATLPVVCSLCLSTENLIIRNGKPIRRCKPCRAAETKQALKRNNTD